jgi:chorismate--pyruvate lyase
MSLSGQDCVVARSVTPFTAAQGFWQALRHLRNRPLADILYHDRTIIRSEFEFATLSLGTPLYGLCQKAAIPKRSLLARRSVFVRAAQPLLVAEAFLPSFWKVAQPF